MYVGAYIQSKVRFKATATSTLWTGHPRGVAAIHLSFKAPTDNNRFAKYRRDNAWNAQNCGDRYVTRCTNARSP